MELWIRSQDKEYLEKVEKIYMWGNAPDGYVIESKGELGTYKTKERALEVLDEITDFIDGLNKTNTITIYEMPEE